MYAGCPIYVVFRMRGLYVEVDLWCVCSGELIGWCVCLIDEIDCGIVCMKLIGGYVIRSLKLPITDILEGLC